MVEDYPRCKVEMVDKCNGKDKSSCRKYPAMRCKIEKRTVTKTKPETR